MVCVSAGALGSQPLSACGDKFLLLGRGVRFQRAYAAVHPASILLVLPPKSVKNAAVRDPKLQSALKMAGHRVDVIAPARLRDALTGGRYDIVVAGRADAMDVADALTGAPKKPAVIGLLESAEDVSAGGQRLDAVLKTPQPLLNILRLLDDVMKARLDRSRAAGL